MDTWQKRLPRSAISLSNLWLLYSAFLLQDSETGSLFAHAPANMGTCENFVASAAWDGSHEDQEPLSPRAMLNDVVHTISCDYEANTDWGKDVGWMYGSVTEDILTGALVCLAEERRRALS